MSSSQEFLKIVSELKEKEDLARICCSTTLKLLSNLTRETVLLNLTTILKLLEMEPTPARNASLKYYKTEQGADETITCLLDNADKKLSPLPVST
ncbi:hypothetical protein QVD17_19876 [Tagetes erecta]|uniref:Uncharacterized protein n=1 Tax=Tagetes erecta TaxID=13708 RepID=A0AAD8NQH3_TARER|nr:hypothetical protein QVD17_19876 [Tagetes erecta]